MSGKVGANFRPPAEKLHLPRFTMDWAFPMNGRPDGLGVPDEWAFPSNAMAFPSNGRSDEWKGLQFAARWRQIAPSAFYFLSPNGTPWKLRGS